MGCSDSNESKAVPPDSTLIIEGVTGDTRIMQAITHATASLKQAGVSRLRIDDFDILGVKGTDILPLGGNRPEVNASLEGIQKELRGAGLEVGEVPAFRCVGSPMQLEVTRSSNGRTK